VKRAAPTEPLTLSRECGGGTTDLILDVDGYFK
jgi:hypothetical protein